MRQNRNQLAAFLAAFLLALWASTTLLPLGCSGPQSPGEDAAAPAAATAEPPRDEAPAEPDPEAAPAETDGEPAPEGELPFAPEEPPAPAGEDPAQPEDPAAPAEEPVAPAEDPAAPAEEPAAPAEDPAAPAEEPPAPAEEPAAPPEEHAAPPEEPPAPPEEPAQPKEPKIAPEKVTGGCLDGGCHKTQVSHKKLHSPVSDKECDSCHEQNGDEHRFEDVDASAKLCYECHDEFKGAVIHFPLEDGDCGSCHDPHGGETKHFLDSTDKKTLCGECHEDVFEKKLLHGPLNDDDCVSCHKVHASDFKKLLNQKSVADICSDCHDEVLDDAKDHASVHEPVQGDCTGCHDPHGGSGSTFLKGEGPDFCFRCHKDMGVAAGRAAAAHGVWKGGTACLACHVPHSGAKAKLLKDKGGECLDCHGVAVKTADGRLLPAQAADPGSQHRHDPVATGACKACHDPHFSDAKALLKGAYPQGTYAPWDEGAAYSLCFSCHAREAFASETGGGTNFKQGERNLHFLHVVRKKGRSCAVCHEAHAAGNERLIRVSTAFGSRGWALELGFKVEGEGGSCAPGCHKPFAYAPAARIAPPTTTPGSSEEERE